MRQFKRIFEYKPSGKKMKLEDLILHLSTGATVRRGPVFDEMFRVHNEIYDSGVESKYIKSRENVSTRCGSCIRRCQTNLLKHYYEYMWEEGCGLKLRMVDPQGGKPLFVRDENKENDSGAEASDEAVKAQDAYEDLPKWEDILAEGETPKDAYTRLMGKKPFHGWDDDTLLYKLKHIV